ncbi:hypothetical protein M8J77_024088 [Diaphorina citri]|nr:hypothetical protein M8J77_024088 [Diaphorina citri]
MKCYDKINHDVLLGKMFNFGFSLSLLEFFASYLQHRKQIVVYRDGDGNEIYSQPYTPSSSVPQGSCLSGLLFIIVIDGIGSAIQNSKYLLYADDFKLYREINTENDCILLQQDLNSVVNWLEQNKLTLHKDKCESMSFSNSRTPIRFTYKINTHELTTLDVKKDLGVTFEKDFKFNVHINNITTDAYRVLGLVQRQSKDFHNINTILILYKALVRSKLEYASLVWNPHTESNKNLIENVQNKFVRHLFWKFNGFYPTYPNPISARLLCEQLELDSLEMRRGVSSLTFIHDYMNNKIHCPTVQEEIHLAVPVTALRPRAGRGLFAFDSSCKNIYLKSTVPRGQVLFNHHSNSLDLAMHRESYNKGVAERLLKQTEDQYNWEQEEPHIQM